MADCIVCGKRAYSQYCVHHKPRKAIKVSNPQPLKRTPLPRPAKRINQIGRVGRKHQEFRKAWIESHPAPWFCYLKIHPLCPIILHEDTLTLEHVKAKSSRQGIGLRWSDDNIRPACAPCNGMKGSRSLEQVREKLK